MITRSRTNRYSRAERRRVVPSAVVAAALGIGIVALLAATVSLVSNPLSATHERSSERQTGQVNEEQAASEGGCSKDGKVRASVAAIVSCSSRERRRPKFRNQALQNVCSGGGNTSTSANVTPSYRALTIPVIEDTYVRGPGPGNLCRSMYSNVGTLELKERSTRDSFGPAGCQLQCSTGRAKHAAENYGKDPTLMVCGEIG